VSKFVDCAAVTLALLIFAAGGANAQQKYPTKPIRLIVPMAAGGGVDGLARVIAQQISESLGQPIVVDNRTGGGGTIGIGTAVRASPDGYTLIMVNASYGANPALYKLPYDSVTDIQPIIQLGKSGLLMSLHPSVPSKSVNEFIAYAKANPGKLNYSSAGTGTLGHLAGELFKLETKVDFTHVPYKGAAPALTAQIGGEVQLSFSSIAATIPHVKAGRLRAIGVTTATRSGALPDVPTVGETVPGFEVDFWYGIWGPKDLPKEIVARWNREVGKVVQTDEMRNRMAREGVEPAGGSPEQFFNTVKRDVEKWKKVVEEANISLAQ
jgi:tripartite-type tricarboxylate transporter receptor subunit TctC